MSETLRYGTLYHIRNHYSSVGEYLDVNGAARGCSSNLYDVNTSRLKDREGVGTGVWRILPIAGVARKDGGEVLLTDTLYLENVYSKSSFLDICGNCEGCKGINRHDVSASPIKERTRDERSSHWKLQRAANNGKDTPIVVDEPVHIVSQSSHGVAYLDTCGSSVASDAVRDVSTSSSPRRDGLSGTWSFVSYDDSARKAMEGVVGQIVRVLRAKREYEGVTYAASYGNKFTLLDTPRLWGLGTPDQMGEYLPVRTLRENVQVQIVLSNELRNFGGSAGKVLEFLKVLYLADVYAKGSFRQFPARTDVEGWAKLTEGSSALCSIDEIYETLHDKPRHGEERIIADFNSKLKLARLHYSENMDKWMVDGKSIEAGNHAKVYIVDDKCFYVGSDNMYVSLDRRGLQEFGYLVNDQAETQKFLKLYWEPLWRYSGKHALTASV